MASRRLLVLGATGGTGRQIVSQAVAAGHEVTAFVRTPEKMTVQHPRLRVVAGGLEDGGAGLAAALTGQDSMMSALGRGTSLKSGSLIQRSMPAILTALRRSGVRRLVWLSALGVGDAYAEAPPFSKVVIRLLLQDIYADKAAGEQVLRASDVDWTIVQPAMLTNGPMTGRYQSGERLIPRGIARISRADTAHFMLAVLDDAASVRKVVRLSY